LRQLTQEMAGSQVQALIILGGNPAYTAPADIAFADALKSVPFSVHLSLHVDETSALTTWHIPAAHYLEAWSDARAYDGTMSIIQPLIAPLYGGKSAHELLAALSGQADAKSYDLVLANWQSQRRIDFPTFWRTALNKGIVDGTAAEPTTPSPG